MSPSIEVWLCFYYPWPYDQLAMAVYCIVPSYPMATHPEFPIAMQQRTSSLEADGSRCKCTGFCSCDDILPASRTV
eukprot:1150543-Pelagomonas_calceolata.AAC.2